MRIEDQLRRSARQIADGVIPPAPDIEGLRDRAGAARRRRTLGWATATAAGATTAAVLIAGLMSQPKAEEPAPVTPIGHSEVVWYDAAGLHRGDGIMEIPLEPPNCPEDETAFLWCSPFTSLALVRDGVVYGDQTQQVWYQPWDGEARIIGNGSEVGPAGDPDGTTAAWAEGLDIVMYDTSTGTEFSRIEVPPHAMPPSGQRENAHGNMIMDVDADGVTYGGPIMAFRVDRATSITTKLWEAQKPYKNGILPEGDVRGGLLATMDTDRVTTVQSRDGLTRFKLPAGHLNPPLRFSPDGHYLAGLGGDRAAVADVRTGQLFHTPQLDAYPIIGWGYGDTLMVLQYPVDEQTGNPGSSADIRLLACDVSQRSCESVDFTGPVTLPSG